MLSFINKPEYIFRPRQIIRRIINNYRVQEQFMVVRLPWGLEISVRANDAIGKAIQNMGIYDLTVTEVIYRLINQNEYVIDIGANIGYFTGLMALLVGDGGSVLAVEAHPKVYAELSNNVKKWSHVRGIGQIHICESALGAIDGSGYLVEPIGFHENRGLAKLVNSDCTSMIEVPAGLKVKLVKLDSLIQRYQIGLMKIDVEGSERDVLCGANNILEKQLIRDIIFEDFIPPPSPVMELLSGHGYKIFALCRTFFGPKLENPGGNITRFGWESPNYLATLQPDRAITKISTLGWHCLRSLPDL